MSNPRPTKAERTAEAREKARALREEQQRKEKRNKLLVRWGVVVAVVAVIALIFAVVFSNMNRSIPAAGPVPANGNLDGGVTLTSTTSLAPTDGGEVDTENLPEGSGEGQPPRGVEPGAEGEPVPIVVYADVNCVHCATFEDVYGDQIAQWLDAGEITYEYRLVSFLDRNSPTNYSSRGANAAACVADTAPESYWDFTAAIFAQHAQGEVDNQGLADMAASVGAEGAESCIKDDGFRTYVKYTTELAQADGVQGTPTVYVNGTEANLDAFTETVQAAIDGNGGADSE